MLDAPADCWETYIHRSGRTGRDGKVTMGRAGKVRTGRAGKVRMGR